MSAFDDMLAAYPILNDRDHLNALHEVMQQVTLAGLARGGFFEKAAFYGGTCLRIFHGLPRFSEDMDFSLLATDESFRLEPYFDAIHDAFASLGQNVQLTAKEKTKPSPIRSAFLKSDTAQYDLRLERGRNITIKIEVDTTPPLGFSTEKKLLLLPHSFMVNCFSLSSLYAGKMHALLFRAWKNRVKGRDWYDFEWYVRHGVKLDFHHFCERVRQFKSHSREEMTGQDFHQLLRDKINAADISLIRRDVEPFLRDTSGLSIWSREYFSMLAEQMKLV